MSLLPLSENPGTSPKAKRGRPELKVVLDTIHERLDDLLQRVDALRPDPFLSCLNRIAFALESIAGSPTPQATPATSQAPIQATPAPTPAPTPTPPAKAAVAPAAVATPAAVDIRGAAVRFVEKWGRDVLVGILAKHSVSGKLSDVQDMHAFMLALADYESVAGKDG